MANLKYETDVLDILHSEALVNIIQECAHHPKQKINKLSENFWLFCFIIWHFPKTYHFNNIPQSQNLVFLWHFSSAKYCTAPRLTQTLYIVLLYWIAFKLYLVYIITQMVYSSELILGAWLGLNSAQVRLLGSTLTRRLSELLWNYKP